MLILISAVRLAALPIRAFLISIVFPFAAVEIILVLWPWNIGNILFALLVILIP